MDMSQCHIGKRRKTRNIHLIKSTHTYRLGITGFRCLTTCSIELMGNQYISFLRIHLLSLQKKFYRLIIIPAYLFPSVFHFYLCFPVAVSLFSCSILSVCFLFALFH